MQLEREAEKRAEEAALFATQADQAERQRGTTTLAQKFSDKSGDAILRADEVTFKFQSCCHAPFAGVSGLWSLISTHCEAGTIAGRCNRAAEY